MTIRKTLGGDRLGSGKKMQVELHNYERSNQDLSSIWRSTMAAGTLVPFMKLVGLPGDTFDIDLDCIVKTHPTIGPLFGSYKVQLDVFRSAIRLYNGQLHNNKLNIGMKISDVVLPKLAVQANSQIPITDNSQINPSCILKYLGISGLGTPTVSSPNSIDRKFNAVPFLSYWDIYKNYYANKQEEIGVVVHSDRPTVTQNLVEMTITLSDTGDPVTIPQKPITATIPAGPFHLLHWEDSGAEQNRNEIIINTSQGPKNIEQLSNEWNRVGTTTTFGLADMNELIIYSWEYTTDSIPPTTKPKLQTFPLDNIDKMRQELLQATMTPIEYVLSQASRAPYGLVLEQNSDWDTTCTQTQEGLAIKTYQSDLFNNWLQTDWVEGSGSISDITKVNIEAGAFTIDQLNLSKKVYDMLNRIAVSGGSYYDYIEATYAHSNYTRDETPVYMRGLSKELVFEEIVSNSATETSAGGNQPLGQLAGRGVMAGKHKGGQITIHVDEPCYILGIISLTPRVDYSQGNDWDVNLNTLNDLHKPALDEIGFQNLITDQMAWWSTDKTNGQPPLYKSAGKQPAWINYMTAVNQTYGNFADPNNEMFMTLNRRYEVGNEPGEIEDLTTYIDPSKFNFIFAETDLGAQNFWVQIKKDIYARRKMSAKIMPNL